MSSNKGIAIVLAVAYNFPVGARVRDFDKELLDELRTCSPDSFIRRVFPVNPTYLDSPELAKTLSDLVIGGTLVRDPVLEQHAEYRLPLEKRCYAKQKVRNSGLRTKDIAYLAEVSERILTKQQNPKPI